MIAIDWRPEKNYMRYAPLAECTLERLEVDGLDCRIRSVLFSCVIVRCVITKTAEIGHLLPMYGDLST